MNTNKEPISEHTWPSDHFLRIVTALGVITIVLSMLSAVGGFFYYAGKSEQRLQQMEEALLEHKLKEYHGDVGPRITSLEVQMQSVLAAINRLVTRLDKQTDFNRN